MWVWDQETMRILAVNEAAVRVYGYTRDAFLTMSADEITAGQVIELDRWDSGSNPVTAGIVHAGIWKQRRKGGDLFDAEIAACSISFDGREAWLVSANDVTDRLRAEETLKEADRRKDEFLAMLAHELRNPLAALSHALELQQLVPDETIKRHAHEMMDRQVKHLGRLVDDLLDVSRITRGKIVLRRETVDMAALVKNAVVAVRGLIEQRHQQLFLELPPDPVWTRGDPIRLEQVVVNLLNNASKYSDPGSQIRLILEARSDATELRVRDNGIGIDADMLPRIFDLFAQSDRSLDRSTGGLGIGLTLAQRLVELHGGSISVSSGGRGQGSEFTVSLPIVTEPASISSTAECTVDRSAPLRLLIIEDNTDAAESLRMLLGMIGHEVVYVAHDGRSGLEAVCLHHPDVVLLDIGLPTMDGYAVARELRTRSELAGISLIAMTGYGQDEDQRRAREAGFDYHVTKPVGVASLEALFAQIRPAIAPARELVTSKTD
jgi:PAS domain S-box-containing protein